MKFPFYRMTSFPLFFFSLKRKTREFIILFRIYRKIDPSPYRLNNFFIILTKDNKQVNPNLYNSILHSVQNEIVGRKKELELITACLMSGKHILLEGPPGTSKSTMLRLISQHSQLPIHILEGNADLTPAKLVGNFDPALVLEHGIKPDFFVRGPLLLAMEEGGILYIDEFNRMASDASNALIRAIEERELVIPRFGIIHAHDNFRVVLAQNPFDDVGVGRISRALFDRLIRITTDYQSMLEEHEIVVHEAKDLHLEKIDHELIRLGIQMTRATRHHPEIKQGASVRGAIDFITIYTSLKKINTNRTPYGLLRDAFWAALSGKIWLDPSSENTPEKIIEELLKGFLDSSDNEFDLGDLSEFDELKKKL